MIKEMNAFYIQSELHQLSSSACVLWYTLLQVNNKVGWKKEFTVAAPLLLSKSGLSKAKFRNGRTELEEKGFIHVQSRDGNQSAIYQMVSLTNSDVNPNHSTTHINDDKEDACQTKEQKTTHNMTHKQADKPALLNKQHILKENTDNTTTATVIFYQENFGNVKGHLKNELQAWEQKVGEELLLEAMKQAVESNIYKWNYVKGILREWDKKGLTTIEQVEADRQAFKSAKQNKNPGKEKEIIPSWFEERKDKPAASVSQEVADPVEVAKAKAMLDNYLKEKEDKNISKAT